MDKISDNSEMMHNTLGPSTNDLVLLVGTPELHIWEPLK
jgi:hypothetical protein